MHPPPRLVLSSPPPNLVPARTVQSQLVHTAESHYALSALKAACAQAHTGKDTHPTTSTCRNQLAITIPPAAAAQGGAASCRCHNHTCERLSPRKKGSGVSLSTRPASLKRRCTSGGTVKSPLPRMTSSIRPSCRNSPVRGAAAQRGMHMAYGGRKTRACRATPSSPPAEWVNWGWEHTCPLRPTP